MELSLYKQTHIFHLLNFVVVVEIKRLIYHYQNELISVKNGTQGYQSLIRIFLGK